MKMIFPLDILFHLLICLVQWNLWMDGSVIIIVAVASQTVSVTF